MAMHVHYHSLQGNTNVHMQPGPSVRASVCGFSFIKCFTCVLCCFPCRGSLL